MSILTHFLHKSLEKLPHSACTYESVDLGAVDYEPELPFKALTITGAGNVVIEGMDGVQVSLPVAAGPQPYGGAKIIRAGTTAVGIIAHR